MPLVLREHPDLARIDAYLTETPRARTRRFAALHTSDADVTRLTAEVFMVEEPGRVRPLWQVGPTPHTQCDVRR
jgi:hypothetical protein